MIAEAEFPLVSTFVIPTTRAARMEESVAGRQYRCCKPTADSSVAAARLVGMTKPEVKVQISKVQSPKPKPGAGARGQDSPLFRQHSHSPSENRAMHSHHRTDESICPAGPRGAAKC